LQSVQAAEIESMITFNEIETGRGQIKLLLCNDLEILDGLLGIILLRLDYPKKSWASRSVSTQGESAIINPRQQDSRVVLSQEIDIELLSSGKLFPRIRDRKCIIIESWKCRHLGTEI
jgi:hypothetical protein